MKTSWLMIIGLAILVFTAACTLPFNITVNIGAANTNTPAPPSIAPSATIGSTLTPMVNTTKTAEAAAVLTRFAATSTAEIENKIQGLAECMQDVPIRGNDGYNTVICEDFNDNANQWKTGSDEDERYGMNSRLIQDGQYVWEVSSKHGVFHWECINTPDLDNFEASILVQKLHGPTSDACYALVYRVEKKTEDEWDFYSYFVCDDNIFYVARQFNNAWSPVVYSKSAGAVKPGSLNWLTVVATGSKFDFYVNDHKAGVGTDDRLKSGGICIGMQIPANLNAGFAFDKFVVRAP